jgi:hypothetical protein
MRTFTNQIASRGIDVSTSRCCFPIDHRSAFICHGTATYYCTVTDPGSVEHHSLLVMETRFDMTNGAAQIAVF